MNKKLLFTVLFGVTLSVVVLWVLMLTHASRTSSPNTSSSRPAAPPTQQEKLKALIIRMVEANEKCGQTILQAPETGAKRYDEATKNVGTGFIATAGSFRRLAEDKDLSLAELKNGTIIQGLQKLVLFLRAGLPKNTELERLHPILRKNVEAQNACAKDIHDAELDFISFVESEAPEKVAAPVKSYRASPTPFDAVAEITARRYQECVRQRTAFGVDTAPCAEWARER